MLYDIEQIDSKFFFYSRTHFVRQIFSALICNRPYRICLPANDNFEAHIYVGVSFGRCGNGPVAGTTTLPTQIDTVSAENIRAFTALAARHLDMPVSGSILTDLEQFVAAATILDDVTLDNVDAETLCDASVVVSENS